MPELPEVETVCRGLAPLMTGRRLVAVEARRPDLRRPFPVDLAQRLIGSRIDALTRRAKYLLIDTDRGDSLILHLGMSGRIRILPPGAGDSVLEPHDHLVWETGEGVRFAFQDPRRFGMALLARTSDLAGHPLLRDLGPEPLSPALTPGYLRQALHRRRTPLKAALLDQHLLAGLGNIYVCEALYRARLSPRRQTATVGPARAARLAEAIRAVLTDAIAAGGSSLRDYRGVNGELGYFAASFDVYGRAGEPCRRSGCAGRIRRIAQAGRSSFFCPVCQR